MPHAAGIATLEKSGKPVPLTPEAFSQKTILQACVLQHKVASWILQDREIRACAFFPSETFDACYALNTGEIAGSALTTCRARAESKLR